MQLSFVAPGLRLIPIPGRVCRPGDLPSRLSMRFAGADAKGTPHFKPVERARTVEKGTPQAEAMLRLCRKGEVLPADEQTAQEAGVRYVPLQWGASTGFVPQAQAAKPAKKVSA